MSTRRKPRRRPAHLMLVQKLPTRPPLHRRLLRMLSPTSIALGCTLALLAVAAIYAAWPTEPHRSAQVAKKSRETHEMHEAVSTESNNRAHQLASTQQHVLMARVY